jgi:hypothetical protein
MKKIFIYLIFLISLNASSQDNYWELLGYPKVLINKKLTSYSIAYSTIKNGIEQELKTNKPSFDNPYYIQIFSNETSGKVIINNKYMTEDIVLKFKYIYKSNDKKDTENTMYYFLIEDERYNINYNVSKKHNHTLIITLKDDSKNSTTFMYTIAKN